MGKVRAIAMITDPTAVAAKRTALGQTVSHKGAIYCSVPELGLVGTNLVYCRYGMSIPYIQVQVGWALWAEPTIDSLLGGTDRWVYTGFADCGGDLADDPVTADQMLIQLLSQVLYASTAGTIHLSSKTALEALVLGTTLKTTLESLIDAVLAITQPTVGGDTTTGPLVNAADFTAIKSGLSSILSTKVFTE